MRRLHPEGQTHRHQCDPPLVFHDEAHGILDLQVFRRAALLHLGCRRVLLVLDVLQRVLHQVAHRPVLGGIQRLDVLQDVKHLRQRTARQWTMRLGGAERVLCSERRFISDWM